ncbi:hypothetical protein DAPK24_038530 [Pichia kluyveri]|uniref:C2H2-type domain-containing protein n=1 Tax=Pichia kluyveri TaxID=36015 RepID=A0AAV5R903_PICKL|nr:hypothetical protein DAPK24_038530 [Pichia kluyveri]
MSYYTPTNPTNNQFIPYPYPSPIPTPINYNNNNNNNNNNNIIPNNNNTGYYYNYTYNNVQLNTNTNTNTNYNQYPIYYTNTIQLPIHPLIQPKFIPKRIITPPITTTTTTKTLYKRKRRKYNEIKRIYKCNYQNCNKSYGTLNHLNFHIQLQNHGIKRNPIEFKHLKKD